MLNSPTTGSLLSRQVLLPQSGYALVVIEIWPTSQLGNSRFTRVLDFFFQDADFVQLLQDTWILEVFPQEGGWVPWLQRA